MPAPYKPEGFHTLTPNIISNRAHDLIAFLAKAFDAKVNVRLTLPSGALIHCEVQIGDSRLNIAQAMEGWPEHPLLAQIFVADSAAIFAKAVAAGAQELEPVSDRPFGIREGRLKDPFGNTWTVATMTEQLSPEEVQRRINAHAS